MQEDSLTNGSLNSNWPRSYGSYSPTPHGTLIPVPSSVDERCILISGLHPQTLADTIGSVFAKFGEVERVQIDTDDSGQSKRSAVVLYARTPARLDFVKMPLRIDGRQVKMNFAPRDFALTYDWKEPRRSLNSSRVTAKRFSLGVMAAPKTFAEMWATENNVLYVIDYEARQMQVIFGHLGQKYRMEVSFKDLENDIKMEREQDSTTFTIQQRYPPRMWRQKLVKEGPTSSQATKTSYSKVWERVLDIPLNEEAVKNFEAETNGKRIAVMPMCSTNVINLGRWLTFRLKFEPDSKRQKYFDEMLRDAASYNLIPHDYQQRRPLPLRVISASSLPEVHNHIYRANHIPSFDVLYFLEAAISARCIEEINLDDDFYDNLIRIGRIDPAYALGILSMMMDEGRRIWRPLEYCLEIFEKKRSKVVLQPKIPEHCIPVRKIIVSPTSLYLQPPVTEVTNRVVRHFREHADRFVRVQFVDEGMRRIGASFGGENNDAIYNRIYKALQNGIQVGSRRYDFLAFSSSQLRGHGCWFFAPTKDLNANMIRAWMGTFSHVKIVAKHAVRMGQCFSSTTPTTTLKPEEVEYIDDIVRNGYTFSDGVGKISPSLAREVAQLLNLEQTPSCIQFRLGGAKGVLSISNYLRGRKIQLRPSQIKFESPHTVLEVIRTSTFLPAYLNRQAIVLLSALGIKDEVFMNMTNNMLDAMNKMLRNPSTAIKMICENMDEYGSARSMAQIVGAGFLERHDPYITNLINLFRVSRLKDLKEKARIHVPNGAFLLGILDETGTLEENEIFCQVSVNNNATSGNGGRRRKVITGECIIFRNPCFHPGDIRVVTAVENDKLKHLVDVIVFPSKGFRDIPSMLSGGDLDGDDYTVIWDPILMPPTRNYTPFSYASEEPLTVDQVKISHIQKFFVNYINNDNLGQIANAHLATADASPMGALDGRCLRLAQLHSSAVDFPKTGKPAKFDSDLRVRMFPDFMQKKDKETYISKKVLGRIYRAINSDDYENYKTKLLDDTEFDPRLRVEGMERYIAEARELRARYNRDVTSLMNQYGIHTEAELLSGFVIDWGKKANTRKSTYDMTKQTMKTVSRLREEYQAEFEREFWLEGTKTISRDARPLLDAKAAAWYYVTYHPEERRRDISPEGKLLGFPWTVYPYICDIARRNTQRKVEPWMLDAFDEEVIEQHCRAGTGNSRIQVFSTQIEDDEVDSEEDDGDEEEDEEEDEDFPHPTLEIKLSDLGLSVENANALVARDQPNTTTTDKQNTPLPPLPPTEDAVHLSVNQSDEDIMKALLG